MNSEPVYPSDGRYALSERKTLRPLLGSMVKIWLSKPSVFIVAALVVVVPFELVITGALGGGFGNRDGDASELWAAVDGFVVGLLGQSLVTAAHARAVVALAGGQRVSTWTALRLGGGAVIPVLGVAVLTTLAVIAGTIALILPGIYLAVVLMFSSQVAALTHTGIGDSMDSSIKLVRAAGWWRTFGYLLLISLLANLLGFAAGLPLALGADAISDDSLAGAAAVVAYAIALAVIYSFTALLQSLLYFSYRAKIGDPWAHKPAPDAPDLDAGNDWNPNTR